MPTDWIDRRSLEELPLGYEWSPTLGEVTKDYPWPDSAFVYTAPTVDSKGQPLPDTFDSAAHRESAFKEWKISWEALPTPEAKAAWAAKHADNIERARRILGGCGVKIAEDIKQLGCTGVFHNGFAVEDIQFLRMALAGSGAGLPCFVPPSLYCLGHETIGGLQDGQKPHHGEYVGDISRPLTPKEADGMRMTNEARRAGGSGMEDRLGKAHSMLMAGSVSESDLAPPEPRGHGAREVPGPEASALHAPDMIPYEPKSAFLCLEHEKKRWSCSFCMAEMIANGALVPSFRLMMPMNTSFEAIKPEEIDDKISDLSDNTGTDKVSVYVEVARYRRKLARD